MRRVYIYAAIAAVGLALLIISINANRVDNLSSWYSFDKGLEISEKEDKPMFVFISSPNCPFCAKMREVLSDSEVMDYIKENYVPVYIDVGKERSPIVVPAYPAFVIIYKGKVVDAWGGYAAKDLFLKKLKSVDISQS